MSGAIRVAIERPGDYELSGIDVQLFLNGAFALHLAEWSREFDVVPDRLELAVPSLPDARIDVSAQAYRNSSGSTAATFARLRNVQSSSGDLQLRLESAPALVAPVTNSSVDSNAVLTWNAGSGIGIYELALYSGRDRTLVYQTSTHRSLRDLLRVSELPQPGVSTSWNVHRILGPQSVDAALHLEIPDPLSGFDGATRSQAAFFRFEP